MFYEDPFGSESAVEGEEPAAAGPGMVTQSRALLEGSGRPELSAQEMSPQSAGRPT